MAERLQLLHVRVPEGLLRQLRNETERRGREASMADVVRQLLTDALQRRAVDWSASVVGRVVDDRMARLHRAVRRAEINAGTAVWQTDRILRALTALAELWTEEGNDPPFGAHFAPGSLRRSILRAQADCRSQLPAGSRPPEDDDPLDAPDWGGPADTAMAEVEEVLGEFDGGGSGGEER
jgi:Arc/MetJ-type ribon-helix-helix transcriptional regulator